jgi:hypothetical protein
MLTRVKATVAMEVLLVLVLVQVLVMCMLQLAAMVVGVGVTAVRGMVLVVGTARMQGVLATTLSCRTAQEIAVVR